MIYILTHTYFLPLICIVLSALIILCLGLFLIFRKNKIDPKLLVPNAETKTSHSSDNPALGFSISSKDISAISGDNVIQTQLDLARAYIETGRKQLAIKILGHVERTGNTQQQSEAAELRKLITAKRARLLDESLQLESRSRITSCEQHDNR